MSLIRNITNQISGLINYSDPLVTITKVINALGIPEKYIGVIEPYCYNKANNQQWINGVINLLTTYETVLKDPFYDYFDFDEKLAYIESKFLVNINPATGQPYGFGSVDLETGEVVQDGVIIKAGMDISQIKKAIDTEPNQAKTNIWPWVLVIGGAVLLKKRKRKNK